MKPILVVLVFAISVFSHVYGQPAYRTGTQAISKVSIEMVQNREVISFTVSREVNVRHYRVEASNDNTNFNVIGTVKAAGNSVLARNYHFGLAGFTYKYYRVGVVGMNGMQYSEVISTPEKIEQPNPENEKPLHAESDTKVIVNR